MKRKIIGFFEGAAIALALLFGSVSGAALVPLSNKESVGAAAECESRRVVVASGAPFGIKIRFNGVMVISVTDNSPAEKAGIKAGDIISIVNGEVVSSNAGLAAAIQKCTETTILLRRGDAEILVTLTPESENGFLKIGAFVRDSAAGIGTLTFREPDSRAFGGLGHAVSDVTTGDAVPLSSGEITTAEIYDVVKGKKGCAGELCGIILPNSDIGEISANTSVGVFGTLSEEYSASEDSGKCVPVAYRREVKTGAATILTTADGNSPAEYSIEIERLNLLDANGSKAMVIRITDKELLSQTGGIVRGMSGSPILQDGKLVGAVTHVFLNDPTRGYGVFADTMLSQCPVTDS
ncbi:MAG: SpoIVB peptidase [Oscillospiraceae bacterium]